MKLARHVKVREEKFGAVIFDTLREKVFVVNKQGKDILWLMLNGKSQEETVEALARAYNGNRDAIARDVANFVAQLMENRLLIKAAERGFDEGLKYR